MPNESHITVGVPVYRGWDFVAETLKSIEQQTHKDFTVLISVDGGDERSAEACRSFLADPRFHMIVQTEQLGWAGNINWLLSQGTGDFFCYYQHDDHTDPTYFKTLLEAAHQESQAAIVYCDMQHFAGWTGLFGQPSIRGTPFERVIGQIEQLNHASFRGLIRYDAIRSAGLLQTTQFDSYAVDAVWIAKLARWGDLVRVPKALYFKRIDPDTVHGKWFRWQHEERREPWIGLFLSFFEVGKSVAGTPAERTRLLNTIVNGLVAPPNKFAFYRPKSAAERQELLKDFFVRAERQGLCTLRRDPERRRVEVMFGASR